MQTVEERRDQEKEVVEGLGFIAPEREKALSALQSMRAALVRVEMRLGQNDQVSMTYRVAANAFRVVLRSGTGAGDANREKAIRDGDADREKAAREAFSAFQSACFEWLNG